VLLVAAMSLAARTGSSADRVSLEARVISETIDGVYVNVGAADGVDKGTRGTIDRSGVELARVEVVAVSKNTALLRLLALTGGERPRAGDRALLAVERPGEPKPQADGAQPRAEPDRQPEREAPGPPAAKGSAAAEEPFVPLLAPPPQAVGSTGAPTVSHGRAWLQEDVQIDSENGLDHSRTRFGLDGSIERMGGSRWSLDWSGELSYRAGDAFRDSRYKDEFDVYIRRWTLVRSFESGGFLRLGRFLPPELPAVGFLDGAQAETELGKHVRVGAMGGLKPRRVDLAPSAAEPTGVAYGTVEAGTRSEWYYSGTLGVLGSIYKGKYDRLALLMDQRADLGPKLSLYSTAELDLDAGSFETRSGARLTHVDAFAVSPITSFLTLRAGVDHYERPDTRAERDLLHIQDPRYFDRGYWRYWVGSSQYLPWNLSLDEEIAFIDAPEERMTPRWRISITRTGLFSLQHAFVSATVFNLDGAGAEGYGGILSAYVPFFENRVSCRPGVGFRLLETDEGAEEFDVTDVSLFVDWWIAQAWRLYGGGIYSFGEALDRTLLEAGIEFRW